MARTCREILQELGLDRVGHAPCVRCRHLPACKEFGAYTGSEADVSAGVGHGFAFAVGYREVDVRTAVDKRRDCLFKTLEISVFEAQVEGDVDLVHDQILFAITLVLPDHAFSKVDLGACHVVKEADVDTETDAREHKFTLHAGLRSGGI